MAFVDVAFNIGVAGFCGLSMARRTNAGNMVGACNALIAWNKITVMRPVKDPDGKPLKDARGKVATIQSTLAPRMSALTKELRNAKPLPVGCVPEADRVRNLDAAIEAANKSIPR